MARAKISEYRAKTILNLTLGTGYYGLCVDTSGDYTSAVNNYLKGQRTSFVVKVDQAVKRRNKLGLVFLDVKPDEVIARIGDLKDKGYQWALVEPFMPHELSKERFVAIQRESDGVHVTYSLAGGVDIEENPDSLKSYKTSNIRDDSKDDVDYSLFEALLTCFEDNHFTYLEINPYINVDGQFIFLDAAVEVDTAAEFFVKGIWTLRDIRDPKKELSDEERSVELLSAKSPSSLSLKLLNRDGSIFLLLSGGGASVVVADEFSNLGYHDKIANYGEYSGNPNEEETYLYSKQIIKLLLASKATKKVLLIAGGVANFTDVSKTFGGIIRALKDNIPHLIRQDVCVLVRRGGPNQVAGLRTMKAFLDKAGLRHVVHGPEVSLAGIVSLAVKELK